jgi:23S rRNA (uridine2552-2'-O)-methyltransferase
LSPGRKVLDLGCWPGSWMQYASDRVGEHGLVVGIDLKALEIALPTWCESIVADVYELRPEQLVERYGPFDVVVSDMAPHTIGDRTTDQLRSEELTRRAFEFACGALRPGGHFAAKVFQGGGLKALLTDVQAAFQEGRSFHAQASRTQSRELYVVGRGLKKQGPRS